MRKFVSTLLIASILAISCSGCKSSPKLDIANFEKYALSDLKLEKKDVSAKDNNAYYDLDYTIDNTQSETKKLDHTAQVYSTAEGPVTSSLIMFYSDYQDENEAKAFFEDLVMQEESMLSSAQTDTKNKSTFSKGENYILILTTQNDINWHFECLYYQKDVILFASIAIGASDINSINKEWLANVKKFFSDLKIKNPFSMAPEIDKLV